MATEPFKHTIACHHDHAKDIERVSSYVVIHSHRPGACLTLDISTDDPPHLRVDEIDELITALTYWRDVYDNGG